ncbi:MAG: hypothetical protein JWO86_685 [Myxococcaceae bacterium]|nr:hypothetical protein [Myxococcaceae bacterium]
MRRRAFAMVVFGSAALASGCRAILGVGEPDVIGATGVVDGSSADTTVAEDGGVEGSVAEGGVCTVGEQRCTGNNVESCSGVGEWGNTWTCSTGVCSGSACAGATTPAQSCAPTGAGLTDCGSELESCCTSLEVPGGTYYRTYGPNAVGGPTDPATVSGFRLDKYLVTVGRFRQFVNAWNGGTGYVPPQGSGVHTHLNGHKGLAMSGQPATFETGWADASNIAPTDANLVRCGSSSTWSVPPPAARENLPINCVTWQEAYAFCIWDGGFLPSEAEWEYAAAGGAMQRKYPWGATDPGTGNQYAIYGGTAVPIARVGTATLGAGRWGQLDLVGDLWEWNLDWSATYASPCIDCAFLTASTYRIKRGGSFQDDASSLLPAQRSSVLPAVRYVDVGIRCARTP